MSNNLHTLNGERLNQIATASETAQVVTLALSDRKRLRHVTDISRVRNNLVASGQKIIDEEYMQYWKDMQSQGVGSIIYGRRGKPNRFEWHYSLKGIAQAALEGKDVQLKSISEPKLKSVTTIKEMKQENTQMELPIDTPKTLKRKPGRPKGFKPRKKIQAQVEKQSEPTTTSEKILMIQVRGNSFIEMKVPANVSREDIEFVIAALRSIKV